MTKSLPLVAIVTLLIAGCGGGERSAQTTAPQPTPTGEPLTVVVYFYKGDRLAPVSVTVPRTRGVANAALRALLNGPPAGYETAIPDDAQARVISIDHGEATLDLAQALKDHANAQIVYTLTAVPRVTGVGYPGMRDPETGEVSDLPLTRAAYEQFAPPILVESPLPHDQVPTPVRVRGTASVYEATLVVELVQNGKVVTKQTVTATEGAPYRGRFLASLQGGEAGPATIVAFAPNAAGGPPQHRVEVPVEITP